MASGNNNTQAAKGNFRSYEGQARLIRAIVAAHPEVKWNFKEIIAHYGSDMSQFALEHRFRDFKAQAKIVVSARKAGYDCLNIPGHLPGKSEKEIAKHYGSSTADGIQWQFRSIKKDADALKAAVGNSADPGAVDISTPRGKGSAAVSTPKTKTPGTNKRATPSSGASTAKRQKTKTKAKNSSGSEFLASVKAEDEDDGFNDGHDYSDLVDTPSKPGNKKGNIKPAPAPAPAPMASLFDTPSRAAASVGKSAIPQQSIDLVGDDKSDDLINPEREVTYAAGAAATKSKVPNSGASTPSFGNLVDNNHNKDDAAVHGDFLAAFDAGGSDDAAADGNGDFDFQRDIGGQGHYDDNDMDDMMLTLDGEI